MSQVLATLAKQGVISSLSRYFGEFIAEQSHQSHDSLLACTAALLSESNQQGNVCIDLNRYQSRSLFDGQGTEETLIAETPSLQAWQDELLSTSVVAGPGELCPLILEQNRLYLYRYWLYETRLAESIRSRIKADPLTSTAELQQILDGLYPDDRYLQQKQAVALALRQRFVLICGGPGTGKTTTVVNILLTLIKQQPDMRIELTAPTGKAAARLMESIRNFVDANAIREGHLLPKRALTIHRLLEYGRNGVGFNKQRRLALDCIIVDEASMVDLTLMYQLVEALPLHTRVILLGDRDQLASVAAGSVLSDMTGRGVDVHYSRDQQLWLENFIPAETTGDHPAGENYPLSDATVFLSESHRFDADSSIGRVADEVNAGNSKAAVEIIRRGGGNTHWQPRLHDRLDDTVLEQILEQYRAVVESESVEQAFTAFEKFRVLCAVGSGPFGVVEVNRRIEQGMLSRGWIRAGEYFHGKTILIHRNDYEQALFNGDTALLWQERGDRLYACFRDNSDRDRIRRIAINNLPDHSPAWAMTIHKSQGSEFDSVLLVLPGSQSKRALSRELLYTGITRAKSRLSIHADQLSIEYACETPEERHSGLADKLGWPATELTQ